VQFDGLVGTNARPKPQLPPLQAIIMRKTILTILTLISLSCKAQIGIYNTSLTDTTLNILYIYPNILTVYGIDNYKLKSTSDLQIDKLSYGSDYYYINVYPRIKTDTIQVIVNDRVIYQRGFVTHKMPYPKIILGETEDTILSLNEITKSPQLNVILPDCFYKHSYNVVNFKVYFYLYSTKIKKRKRKIDTYYKVEYKETEDSLYEARVLQLKDTVYYMTEKGDRIPEILKRKTYIVFGNRLNYAHLTILENMKKGDKIIFDDITVRSTNGADLRLPPLTIYID